ncbi:hypothetical protein AYO40_06815 [Planctomycetaceae bacterium SCGC AG-212-D15]|nr:hypothetical protein AYO40_06815 [Planctomycetaceae bacterium SCGC AG-212-D15]
MTNDSKIGLVLGVCLVIGVAIAFFRKELVAEHPPDNLAASPTAGVVPPQPRGHVAPIATTTSVHKGQNHTVKHGESLYSLAQQYYGDGHKYPEIYKANRRVVNSPDYVAPGTVLFIPDLN